MFFLKGRFKIKFTKGTAVTLLLFAALLAAVAADFVMTGDLSFKLDAVAMGSDISVKTFGRGKKTTAQEIIDTIQREDKFYWSAKEPESFISRINASANSLLTDRRVVNVLSEIIPICADSGGELDLTVGELTKSWNFDADTHIVPSDETIKNALKTVGFGNVAIDNLNVYLRNGAQLDLGAFGKGIACDAAKTVMERSKISGGVAIIGGSILTYGKPSGKEKWTVGLRNPNGSSNEYFAVLEVGECAVSTSGSYEKYFVQNGVLYNHILSAKTGKPVNTTIKSVSVISSSGLLSDALSTICFILGYEKSLEILEKYNSEAVFVDNDNFVYMTDGLEGILTITDGAFKSVQ